MRRKRNLFIPKIATDMMLAVTKNSTSIYFVCKHQCVKHASPITIDHVETCDLFQGYEKLRQHMTKLKAQNIRDYAPGIERRLQLFKTMAEQIKAMEAGGYTVHIERKKTEVIQDPKRPRGRLKAEPAPSSEGIMRHFNPKGSSMAPSPPCQGSLKQGL